MAARAFLRERMRASAQKEKGFSPEKKRKVRESEGEREREKVEKKRDEGYEREKGGEGEFGVHYSAARYNRRSADGTNTG